MPSLDSFSSGIAKVPFNQAVKIAFANSQAVRRGECYKNEEQYRGKQADFICIASTS